MTHAGGAGVSARSPPGRTKTFFFAVWGAFCYFFSMGRIYATFFFLCLTFSSYGGLFATFSLRGGLFVTSSSWCWAFFTMWGSFLLFFFHMGGLFCSQGGFYVFMYFYGLAPSPYNLFCGCMLLCNFHPISSAITYSGHYVPNKAHCNTRVQFTM